MLTYLGLALVVVVVFSKVLNPSSSLLIFGDDIHLTYYFFKKFFAESLWEGTIPWWNPYSFAGQPMMAHPQAILAFYPGNWLFIILPLTTAFSLFLTLHIFWAAAGMYKLLRNWLDVLPAYIGGVIFSLSGFFMVRVWAGHLDMIAAASWLPWVFFAFWKAAERASAKHIVWFAVAIALQLLSGYQTMALFTLEAVAIAAVALAIARRSLKPLIVVIIAVFVAVGLSAIQLLPEREFASRSIRTFPLPYTWTSDFSFAYKLFVTLVYPFYFGDQRSFIGQWPNLAEYAIYIGIIPLGLAIAALVMFLAKRVSFAVLVFVLIAAFSVLLALGPNAPVDILSLLWKIIPFYRVIRLPSRHLVLFVFAMSALSGFGLHYIRAKSLQVILAGFILIELVPFARHFIEVRPIPETRHDPELVTLISPPRCCELFRILPNFGVWLPERERLDFDSSMTYRYFSVTGYDPSILRNYYEFIDAANGKEGTSVLEHNVQVPYIDETRQYLNFLNVKYVWNRTRFYENKNVAPRFFTVQNAVVLGSREEVAQAIRNQAYDLKDTVLFDVAPASIPSEQCKSANVKVVSYELNSISLSVDSTCDSFLVSSEVYYPGWIAWVDGKKTDLYESNMAFRTLFIPKGTHTVVMKYRPTIFLWGGLVSLVTALICIVCLKRIKLHITN